MESVKLNVTPESACAGSATTRETKHTAIAATDDVNRVVHEEEFMGREYSGDARVKSNQLTGSQHEDGSVMYDTRPLTGSITRVSILCLRANCLTTVRTNTTSGLFGENWTLTPHLLETAENRHQRPADLQWSRACLLLHFGGCTRHRQRESIATIQRSNEFQ